MAKAKAKTSAFRYHRFKRSEECAECGASKDVFWHRDQTAIIAEENKDSNAPKVPQKTIHQEAADIVYGDREEAYDDPNINFRKVARMWSGMLDKKLRVVITPQDVALMFILLKISRESFQPKRDNRVDIIGYTLCLQRIIDSETDDGNDAE